jgi:hypothetical protein
VLEWAHSMFEVIQRTEMTWTPGTPTYDQINATTMTELNGSPAEFLLAAGEDGLGREVNPGDIVTDENGNVLGIVGLKSWGPIPPGSPWESVHV